MSSEVDKMQLIIKTSRCLSQPKDIMKITLQHCDNERLRNKVLNGMLPNVAAIAHGILADDIFNDYVQLPKTSRARMMVIEIQ